jgi:hypothetical protein
MTANPRLTLAEWLRMVEMKVPERYREVFPEVKEGDVQLPSLLDFSRKGNRAHIAGGN